MLFLGLGTGLGSALVVENVVESMELAHLSYKNGRSYEDYLGAAALKRQGKKKWRHRVTKVVQRLKTAMQANYVVLGGGNARLLTKLPPCAVLGQNAHAFEGGYRLWTQRYSGATPERFVHHTKKKKISRRQRDS